MTGDTVAQENVITRKINDLNSNGIAVIFAISGGNGTGKTRLSKEILTKLAFHQSFNLGLITKTIRCLTDTNGVTILENFRNAKVDGLFSHIIQYSCAEYQRNGVNVLIDGVQIDTVKLNDDSNILGGVVLEVSNDIKLRRNDKPTTHFKRKLTIHSQTDVRRYAENERFKSINNDGDFDNLYQSVLNWLENLLDRKLKEVSEHA